MIATLEPLLPDVTDAVQLSDTFENRGPAELIRWAMDQYGEKLGIVTSFQKSGMVIIDLAMKIDPRIRVMTIDTGRLPRESYSFMERVRRHYGVDIEIVFPGNEAVQQMVSTEGANLFYKNLDARLRCCNVRKVQPLHRALKGLDAWMTGLRRDQWASRRNIRKIEIDEGHGGIIKISPLADWTEVDIDKYLLENNVPLHPLYQKGYKSIGCEPCTRAVLPGEGSRSGRWWWETNAPKECGIHCGIERRGY